MCLAMPVRRRTTMFTMKKVTLKIEQRIEHPTLLEYLCAVMESTSEWEHDHKRQQEKIGEQIMFKVSFIKGPYLKDSLRVI